MVSQSGNLVSSFLNYAVQTGVGIAKAVSSGNSAQTGIADYLEYFAADPDTKVVLAYLEGVPDGRRLAAAIRRLTAVKPLVVVKGGVASEGQRAALSHTGSLATDDRVFDGVCRQLGVLRAPNVEIAFEWAATPRPGDHVGTQASPEQLAERRRRLLSAAEACRLRASGIDGLATVQLAETVCDAGREVAA